jgi:hypothetical protein
MRNWCPRWAEAKTERAALEPVLFTMPAANGPAAEVQPTASLPDLERIAAPAANGNGNGQVVAPV